MAKSENHLFNNLPTAKEVRKRIIEMSFSANACHIGSALSCVEILLGIFKKMEKDDYFIFSKASGIAAYYAIMEKGDLKNYPLGDKKYAIWAGGSLGHGLPVATGLALADKKRNVYVLMSDAEMQEGTTWESAMFAAHHLLNNLIVLIDYNKFQACGKINRILNIEFLWQKWEAFGWKVIEIEGGHNLETIENALNIDFTGIRIKGAGSLPSGAVGMQPDHADESLKYKPLVIICHTIKGNGISFMEDNNDWHYKNLTPELYEASLRELSN